MKSAEKAIVWKHGKQLNNGSGRVPWNRKSERVLPKYRSTRKCGSPEAWKSGITEECRSMEEWNNGRLQKH